RLPLPRPLPSARDPGSDRKRDGQGPLGAGRSNRSGPRSCAGPPRGGRGRPPRRGGRRPRSGPARWSSHPPQRRAVVAVVDGSDEGVRPADGAGEWGGDFLGGADISELLGEPVVPALV